MANIYRSVEQLVGRTPLMELVKIENKYNLKAKLYAKLELFNPAGSIKDRVALEMINDAEARGIIKAGSAIIEPTSGNTGIGIAAIARARGYRAIIVMPDSMSEERRKLVRAYGAELVLTDGKLGMAGAISEAEKLQSQLPDSIIAGQFDNPANSAAHRKTTGPEIYEDTDGEVDIFIACVGTGGTITGVGEYLKSQNPLVKVIAVEPESSPVLSGGSAGAHGIQGIGAGFVPSVLNTEIYDEIMTVSDKDAFARGRELGVEEGLLVGISSGAALDAAIRVASREENAGKRIVLIFPDTGSRYLSTQMFE
ncbi:MAG: cysteine synthase A [Clostridia bacterium]|nr:cysteine synthase A [Clostridia bacterium]